MQSTAQSYVQMAHQTAKQITGSRQAWTGFLTTAARLYKYPYHEQLMIYAQRPDATACAEYTLWNKTMRRYIRRGSKGIALIDPTSDVPQLRYVFDVADTGAREQSRTPFQWEVNDRNKAVAANALERGYDIPATEGLEQQLHSIAAQLSQVYLLDHWQEIFGIVDGSYLEGYDDYNVGASFRKAASVSLEYALLSRCGLNPEARFGHEDFLPIFDWNTPEAVSVLGTAVSEMSEEVLRHLEITLRNFERSHENERPDISPERRLPDSQPGTAGRTNASGQIRQDAQGIPERTPPNIVQFPDIYRETAYPSAGDRGSGKEQAGSNDASVDGSERRDGSAESRRSPALDRHDEQPESPGGRSDQSGTDIQLSLFPDEAAQIQSIEEAVSAPEAPAASFSHADIEAELCRGTGHMGGKMRVYEMYQRGDNPKTVQAFLKKEYGTRGHSQTFLDGTSGLVFYRPGQGMKFSRFGTDDEMVLKWTAVEKHLRALVASDRYLTAEEKQEYLARQEAAQPAMTEADADIENSADVEPPVITDDYEQPSGYELEYKYASDRLIVFNSKDQNPNQLSPVVARVESDGTVVIIDEHLPEKERLEIQHAAESGLEGYRSQADADIQQMLDHLKELPDFGSSYDSPFTIGDIIYLEGGKPFIVWDIDYYDVTLRSPGLRLPIERLESIESLQRLVERYPQPEKELRQEAVSTVSAMPMDGPDAVMEAQPSEVQPYRPAESPQQPAEPEDSILPVPPPPIENFRITDDRLGEGGAKTKYAANITAIRLLQTLENDGRMATPEEQEVLSRYAGWGGIPQAFDDKNANWSREYAELKSLLSDSEYASARASTLNAHYTSPVVIKAIYEAIERMGFTTGNVLEPACGVGNFFGLLPESMEGSKLYGVELDSVTGRIAAQLYPHASITVSGFEKTDQRDFYDLAVGNVPFGSYKVSDKAYDKLGFFIHDYFFAKTLGQVRPGGVVAFITSKGTMDKQSPEVRRYIAQRAELLGAVRLPNNAFKANAGTEVTSDILFLKKRDSPIVVEPDWVHLRTTEDDIPINSYFADNPEMVLGKMAWDDSMYGSRKDTACLPIEGEDLSEQLSTAMANIRGQITEAELPDGRRGIH